MLMKTHMKSQQKYPRENKTNQNLGFPNKLHLQYKNKTNYLKHFTVLDAFNRKSRPGLFYKKRVLKNFARSLFLKKTRWQRCFPVNFLGTPF